jgi:uncharacterized SAM-dependent methyltransferase
MMKNRRIHSSGYSDIRGVTATFTFNFCSYLKIKFDTHSFVDNQMADLENEVN